MKKIRDRFSGHADIYKKFRPEYPKALYERILGHVASRQRCWDCATGNGQVAQVLATYFKEVEATDISETQLAKAPLLSNISYGVQRAERTNFDDQSFDLITVAQAIHWFDLDAFLKEARRVLRPGGTLAVWGYGLLQFGATCDEQIRHFYTEVVGPYWDGERRHIDSGYVSIPLRLNNARDLNGFRIEKTMNLQSLHGYLTSWSSVQNYMKQHGQNPVDPLIETLRPAWGEGTKTAKFPIFGSFGGV